jgi:DNA-directed RNA polymerase specialized sigma24 family protein
VSRTDQELLARLHSDPAALEELYLRHVGKVVAAVTRRVDDPAEIHDLVAAAFTSAFWSARHFDPARASPLPWLLGLTAFVVAERGRAAVPEPPTWAARRRALNAAECARLERQMRVNAEFRRHYQAMLRLPAGDRAIVELVELDGLTPVQAAEALRVLPSLARLRLTRAQRRMAGPVAPPAVAEDDDLGLDEVGPLELEVLGELRTILYEPDRGARAVRPAHQCHHQTMAGSRRYIAVPVLVVSLVAVLGGAVAAGKLFDPTSGPKAGATDGPRIECYDQLKRNAAVTAVAAGASLFPPGPPPLQACVDAWKRKEAQLASGGTVRRVVPPAMSFVLCQRDRTVGVFPNPAGLTLDAACTSIGATVPADARFAGATVTQVRTFYRDLKARLRQAGLGTGCDSFRDLDAVTRASMRANGLREWKLLDLTSAQALDPQNGAPVFRPDGGKRWTRYIIDPLAGRVIITTAPDGTC